jgi:hypothetical protein
LSSDVVPTLGLLGLGINDFLLVDPISGLRDGGILDFFWWEEIPVSGERSASNFLVVNEDLKK